MVASKPESSWRRLRVRVSLRFFLLTSSAIAMGSGLYVRSAIFQRSARLQIQRLGGWVAYDFERLPNGQIDRTRNSWVPKLVVDICGLDLFHRVVSVNMVYDQVGGIRTENANTSDESLRYVSTFHHLQDLSLTGTQVTDESLSELHSLKELARLYFWNAELVTDRGACHIRHLKRLKHLHIDNSKITDASLKTFSELPQLETLSLQNHSFSDRGLEYLGNAPRLKSLWIGFGTGSYTDCGLLALKQLHGLEELDVQGSNVTETGIMALAELPRLKRLYVSGTRLANIHQVRSALPNCNVE